MEIGSSNPLGAPRALVACGLAMAIGWGIRGNFGHEYGAMIAGVLGALAVVIFSGREDWRARAPYLAFFGALGWAFGGSISYMQVISYTHSGHLPSQIHGFAGLFWIGFLWAGLGIGGIALAAVLDVSRLAALLRPLLFVFAAFALQDLLTPYLERLLADPSVPGVDTGWGRHRSPLYWFDSDWLAAVFALLGIAAFDLWERRRERNLLLLPAFVALGAALGFGLQQALEALGWAEPLAAALTRPLGDPGAVLVETGRPAPPGELLTNWPLFFHTHPHCIGWLLGAGAGAVVYFLRWSGLRAEAALPAYLASGWLLFFVGGPVLGGLLLESAGGLSMTPPRSDDWAGITGVFAAYQLWLRRNGLGEVSRASLLGAFFGGVAFSGAQFLKLVCIWPGNGYRRLAELQKALQRAPAAELAALRAEIQRRAAEITARSSFWAYWQSHNWHSVLEQTYGFLNGLGTAVALGWLSRRTPPLKTAPPPARGWTVFALFFAALAVPYFNLAKNVRVWTETTPPLMPEAMRPPFLGFEWARLPAGVWFAVFYGVLCAGFLGVALAARRSPPAVLPPSRLGRAQLLFLWFLWVMVAGNFERLLPRFGEGRLVTEGTLFVAAVAASVLALLGPEGRAAWVPLRPQGVRRGLWAALLAGALGLVALETAGTRALYGSAWSGHSGHHLRYGPNADWRVRPNLKSRRHR